MIGRKLVERLVKADSSQQEHKVNADRAQRMLLESKQALETYQIQVCVALSECEKAMFTF